MTPQQRVREFTNESLTVSQGHLFCTACRERLSLKRSIIKNHVQCTKHKKALNELPTYLSEAADVDRDFDQLQWWRLHATTLPHWLAADSNTTVICGS